MPHTSSEKAAAALLLRFADIERRLCCLEATKASCTASAPGSLTDDCAQNVRVQGTCVTCLLRSLNTVQQLTAEMC